MKRSKIQSVLLDALKTAGATLKSSIGKKNKSIERKSELSIVTIIDKKCEKQIISIIRKAFPDHAILTEESPPMGRSTSRWIIDPLDGTTNFAHDYPACCVSIGYEENGKIQFGGVYNPFHNELFLAERGKGATLNGKRIRVSSTPSLRESLACTGFPYDVRERPDEYLALFRAFMMKVIGIRRTGSAALDLCYVACGRFDIFWECHLQPWDKAAAMLIVTEAGGTLTNFSGEPLTLEDTQNAVSNTRVHKETLEVLKPFRGLAK